MARTRLQDVGKGSATAGRDTKGVKNKQGTLARVM